MLIVDAGDHGNELMVFNTTWTSLPFVNYDSDQDVLKKDLDIATMCTIHIQKNVSLGFYHFCFHCCCLIYVPPPLFDMIIVVLLRSW